MRFEILGLQRTDADWEELIYRKVVPERQVVEAFIAVPEKATRVDVGAFTEDSPLYWKKAWNLRPGDVEGLKRFVKECRGQCSLF